MWVGSWETEDRSWHRARALPSADGEIQRGDMTKYKDE